MEKTKKIFGYTENEILRIFHEKGDEVDTNNRVNPNTSTLAQLAEASKRMVKEDMDYLTEVYAPLSLKRN